MPPYVFPQKQTSQLDRATLQQLLARQNYVAPELGAAGAAEQAIGAAAPVIQLTPQELADPNSIQPTIASSPGTLQITQADLDAIAAADRPRDLPSPKFPVAYRAPRSRYEDEAEDALVKFRYTTPDDWQGRAALGAMAQAAQARAMEEQEMWRSRLVQDAMAGIVPAVSPDQLETITLADGKTYIADPYTGDWMGVEGAPAEAAQRIATEAHARETERAGKLRDALIAMQAGGASAKADAAEQLQRQKAQGEALGEIVRTARGMADTLIKGRLANGADITSEDVKEIFRSFVGDVAAHYIANGLIDPKMLDALSSLGLEETVVTDEQTRRQEFVKKLMDMDIGFITPQEWAAAYRILGDGPLPSDRAMIKRRLAREKMRGDYGLGNVFWGGLGDNEEKQDDSAVAAQSWINAALKGLNAPPAPKRATSGAAAVTQGAVSPADAAMQGAAAPADAEEFQKLLERVSLGP